MFEYRVTFKRATDGDTIVVDTDLGRKVVIVDDVVRLAGLNCPEIHDKNAEIQNRAAKAMLYVCSKLEGKNVQVKMRTAKPYPDDKYGRWLGTVYYRSTPKMKKAAAAWDGLEGWSCLNEEMLAKGHALPYDGKGVKPV